MAGNPNEVDLPPAGAEPRGGESSSDGAGEDSVIQGSAVGQGNLTKRVDPRWVQILELFLILSMLVEAGGLQLVVHFSLQGLVLPAACDTYDWITSLFQQVSAAGFLAYMLHRKAQLRTHDVAVADSVRIRLLELLLVLSIAFQGAVLHSVSVVSGREALGEPAVSLVGYWLSQGMELLSLLGPVAALAYVLYRGSRSFGAIGLRWTAHDAAFAVPLWLGSVLIYLLVSPLIHLTIQTAVGHGISDPDLAWVLHGPVITLGTLLSLLVTGFFEELLVRAYLMTEVLRFTGSGLLAVTCSVVLQVSYHLYQGLPVGLSHIGWCLLFSLFYLKTRRALPLALAHNLTNFTSLLHYCARLSTAA